VHDGRKKLYSIQKEAERFSQELDLSDLPKSADERARKYAQIVKQKARQQAREQHSTLYMWEEKALHRKYPTRTKQADVYVDHHKTNQWLKSSGLKAETEALIVAAQDQSLATRSYHSRNIIEDGTKPLCRLCSKYDETVDHIVLGCPELAKSEYIHRHDKAAPYIHWKVYQKLNTDTAGKWYDHKPETVTKNQDATILWNIPIHTDREITANKPETVIRDHKNFTCQIIDMAIPSERNTSIKTAEKY